MKTIQVLGTPLAATTYEELIGQCQQWAREDFTWAIDFTNTQIVTMRRHDAGFHEVTSGVDLFVPDGMPLIWTMNRRGAHLEDRVYGPTFMRRCLLATPGSFTHYFLGGSEECLAQLRKRMLDEEPGLQIVGSHHGYFGIEAEAAILQEINALSPDFIWVGLGTPKQQEWVHRQKASIRRGVIFAVGFAFDVNAGTKADAPAWMQRHGLTWVFRMLSEPRRLVTRYLRYNSLFLYYLARETLGRKA